jgi:hypothetical protein
MKGYFPYFFYYLWMLFFVIYSLFQNNCILRVSVIIFVKHGPQIPGSFYTLNKRQRKATSGSVRFFMGLICLDGRTKSRSDHYCHIQPTAILNLHYKAHPRTSPAQVKQKSTLQISPPWCHYSGKMHGSPNNFSPLQKDCFQVHRRKKYLNQKKLI